MQSEPKTVEAYLETLPSERRVVIERIRQSILERLGAGVEEQMQYGMLGYAVKREIYPTGYHCDPKQDLPFISVASQKNFVALYHMGIYMHPDLLTWFQAEYAKTGWKLDMGKSCIRFKNMERIPLDLLDELFSRMDAQAYAAIYKNLDPRVKQ